VPEAVLGSGRGSSRHGVRRPRKVLPPFASPAEFAQRKPLRALATQVRTEAVSTGSRLKAAAISATV